MGRAGAGCDLLEGGFGYVAGLQRPTVRNGAVGCWAVSRAASTGLRLGSTDLRIRHRPDRSVPSCSPPAHQASGGQYLLLWRYWTDSGSSVNSRRLPTFSTRTVRTS